MKDYVLFIFVLLNIFLFGCTQEPFVQKENISAEVLVENASLENVENTSMDIASIEEEVVLEEERVEESSSFVSWYFNGEKWIAEGDAPDCFDPLSLETPVPIDLVTSVLPPGQSRGGDYKGHGGFRFDGSDNEDITVTVPLAGYIVDGSRYIESGEVQYLFDIINPCGIMIRFDHLRTLSPVFANIAETFPEPVVDDSHTTNINPTEVHVGDVIATAVGISGNTVVDWGVYDVRKRNEASQDASWFAEHGWNSQAPYAVCWYYLLSPEDSARVESLAGVTSVEGKESDYC